MDFTGELPILTHKDDVGEPYVGCAVESLVFFFFEIIHRFSCPKGAMPGLLFYRGRSWVITRLTYSSDSVRPSSACLPRAVVVRCPGEKQTPIIAKSESRNKNRTPEQCNYKDICKQGKFLCKGDNRNQIIKK